MSILIDSISKDNAVCISGKWYIAKPLNRISFIKRIKDAIRVLTHKSFTVHYKEDD